MSYYLTHNGSDNSNEILPANTTSYLIEDVMKGRSYSISVFAENVLGNNIASEVIVCKYSLMRILPLSINTITLMIISRTVTVHIHVTFITYFFQITGVPLVIPSTSSNVISPTSTTTTSITSSMTTSSSKPSAGKLFLNHVMILSLFFCHYSILVHTCAMYTRMITPKISYTHTYTPYNIHVSTFSGLEPGAIIGIVIGILSPAVVIITVSAIVIYCVIKGQRTFSIINFFCVFTS